MLNFLFDLLGTLFDFFWKAVGTVFDIAGKLVSAAASVIFYPLTLLAGWGMDHYTAWWPVFCIGWAVLVLLILMLVGWALMAYRRQKR